MSPANNNDNDYIHNCLSQAMDYVINSINTYMSPDMAYDIAVMGTESSPEVGILVKWHDMDIF